MFQKNGNSQEQALIAKNFDILATHQRSGQKLQQPPSLERAKIELGTTLVIDSSGNKFSFFCDLEQFKKYGPGVYLTFKFLKFLLIAMGLALPFAVANIIILVTSQNKHDDRNFQTALESTTYNGQSQHSTLFIAFNYAILLILTISIIWWRCIEPKLVLECTKEVTMPSYFSVILVDIPNYYTEQQFKNFIEQKYGKIHQIYTAKNYHEDIDKYKAINEIIQQFKENQQAYQLNNNIENCTKMVELFLKFREHHQFINDTRCDQKVYQPYWAFITFQNYLQKWRLLEDQKSLASMIPCFTKQSEQAKKNQRLGPIKLIDCEMQPDGVAWQNLNMSNREVALRCILIAFLLLLFLFISITIIFILVAAQSGLYISKAKKQSFEEIIKSNSPELLENYCLKLGIIKFRSMRRCLAFQNSYTNYCILFFIFPLVITILKMIFGSIMKNLVEIRKHKNSFEKLQWQIIIISLFYFIKAGLIKFVLYRRFIFGDLKIQLLQLYMPILMRLKAFLPIYPEEITIYNHFSGQWVAQASHKVILIAIFSFNFAILWHFIAQIIMKKYHERRAAKMTTQSQINKELKGCQFHIEMIYAQIISLFLFCMMYFTCMPLVYVFVFFSLVLLYCTSKYSLVKFCRKPKVYAHGMNTLAVKIILIGLLLNCVVSPIYYQQLQIEQQQQKSWIAEEAHHFYYLILLIAILIYWIGGDYLINFLYQMVNKIRRISNPRFVNESYRSQLKQIVIGKGKVQSYSMHENEEYGHILETLFIMNEIEMNKLGYFKHNKIKELRLKVNKQSTQFQLFDYILISLKNQLSKMSDKSPKNERYLNILSKIKQQIGKQLSEKKREQMMQEVIKSKVRQLVINTNMSEMHAMNMMKMKSQIRSQLSDNMNIDNSPGTDIRFS